MSGRQRSWKTSKTKGDIKVCEVERRTVDQSSKEESQRIKTLKPLLEILTSF